MEVEADEAVDPTEKMEASEDEMADWQSHGGPEALQSGEDHLAGILMVSKGLIKIRLTNLR